MSLAMQRILRAVVIATVISVVLFYSAKQFGPIPTGNTIPGHGDQQDPSQPESPPASKPDEAPPLISHPPLGIPTPEAPKIPSSSTSPSSPTSSSSPVPAVGTIPGIPGKIWQTSKGTDLTNEELNMTDTWLAKNPTFRHERLTDQASDNYVRNRYADHQDIVTLYTGLTIPILRADLLRYLILLADGGIWADLDTTCDQPVSSWLPAEIYNANSTVKTGLVLGLEPDADHGGKKVFTNGVFAAQPGSKHIKVVVDDVVRELYDIAKKKGVGPEGIKLEMISDVVEVTGRKKMTAKIIESLSKTLQKEIVDTDLTNGKEPQYLDDVVILPVPAFASYDGNPKPQGEVLVTHHHAGTWKSAADEAKKNRQKQEEEEAERLKKAAEEASRKQKEVDDEKKKEDDKKKKAKEEGERTRKEEEAKKAKEEAEKKAESDKKTQS
ncbi:alpha 1,6 mannosyltransferase [Arthroderma uncinatum]|uniref:alpha 1,6 mannosyltransferase n=1 Tax=Arthroderma uncinatum TaxID=74035 RepID=UPI00144A98CE|nr:alpha 1,6 mannosyltransferase [Arthroderma uncinatum]KAF3484068.1 alpha 1,6 mannosyltransferase [Arthroderma uncinatum]